MIDKSEIRDQLDRILTHTSMQSGENPGKFLSYVVEETLEGRHQRLKAYTIAINVLHRPETFDPQRDASVRVLAGRVRTLLAAYYAHWGENDPILISIPVGRYIAAFARNPGTYEVKANSDDAFNNIQNPVYAREKSLSGNSLPVILVHPTWNFGGNDCHQKFCAAFDQVLLIALSKWEPICLRAAAINSENAKGRNFFDPNRDCFSADCGLIESDGGQTKLFIKLSHLNTGLYIWTEAFDVSEKIKGDFDSLSELAEKIADHMVQPFGTINRNATLFSRETPVEELSVFECILQNIAYYSYANETSFQRALLAAERAIKIAPKFGLSWATLADLHCERYRLGYGGLAESRDALTDAIYCSEEAIRCNADSAYGRLGMANVNFARGKIESGVQFGDKALELNPGNSSLMCKYGHHRAYSGDWDAGCDLLNTGLKRQLQRKDYQTYVLAEQAFRTGDFKGALEYVSQTRQTEEYFQPMFRSAVFASMGQKPEAKAALQVLIEREPNFTANTAIERLSRDVHHDFVDLVANGLRSAGLQ